MGLLALGDKSGTTDCDTRGQEYDDQYDCVSWHQVIEVWVCG